jgi:hypothetical protein
VSVIDLWSSFPLDPRERDHVALRASDEDRERITAVLTAAFADGRIERDELDERMTVVAQARTLGELPPLVADLVPVRPRTPRTSGALGGMSAEQMHRWAVDQWADQRRSAVFLLLSTSVLFWGLWLVLGGDGFPWPAVVSALALLNVARVTAGRDQIVRDEVRRLEKKQARQQRWTRGLLGPPT